MGQWNPDEYLPPATLTWCQQQLNEIGQELVGHPFKPTDPRIELLGHARSPYQAVYERLRERALQHWDSSREPKLNVCVKPVGAFNWRGESTGQTESI